MHIKYYCYCYKHHRLVNIHCVLIIRGLKWKCSIFFGQKNYILSLNRAFVFGQSVTQLGLCLQADRKWKYYWELSGFGEELPAALPP